MLFGLNNFPLRTRTKKPLLGQSETESDGVSIQIQEEQTNHISTFHFDLKNKIYLIVGRQFYPSPPAIPPPRFLQSKKNLPPLRATNTPLLIYFPTPSPSPSFMNLNYTIITPMP